MTSFKPNFTFTTEIINNLSQIERFHGQLEAMRIPKELELNLERDNLVQSSYISNSIEGNPLSLHEVTNLLLDDRVPTNRDEKEIHNYFGILKEMDKYKNRSIDLTLVKEFHLKQLTGVQDFAGKFRDEPVAIGHNVMGVKGVNFIIKHKPPFHSKEKIKEALNELIVWEKRETNLSVLIKAGIFHHHFVYIHPFKDGNGRTCRLLTTLILLKGGYPINKYFVLDDFYDIDRDLYSDKLHTADAGDKTEWLEYFTEGIMYSLQSALSRIKESYDTLKVENRPTSKEQEVIEIIKEKKEVTSPQLADLLKVSRQQAHGLLSNLMEKGLLDKKGKTKSSYYFLK